MWRNEVAPEERFPETDIWSFPSTRMAYPFITSSKTQQSSPCPCSQCFYKTFGALFLKKQWTIQDNWVLEEGLPHESDKNAPKTQPIKEINKPTDNNDKKDLSEIETMLAAEENFKRSATNIFRKIRKFFASIEYQ